MNGKTKYSGRHRHSRPRAFRRMPIGRWLCALRARRAAALAVPVRPAKQIASAARHEQTRSAGGRWHV